MALPEFELKWPRVDAGWTQRSDYPFPHWDWPVEFEPTRRS